MSETGKPQPIDLMLERQWQNVTSNRQEFVSALDELASDLPGKGRSNLLKLSNWFRKSGKLEEAIHRPDVLAISMPLMKATEDELISPGGIAKAARLGFTMLGRNFLASKRLLRLLVYPLLLAFASILMLAGFSFWIAPEFEKMFIEFGIELPKATDFVFSASALIRKIWYLVISIPLVFIAFVWFMNRTSEASRPANLSWFDQRLISTRYALASWAWHVSLLLEIGFSKRDAVEAAGKAAANSWLRQVSLRWVNRVGDGDEFEPKRIFGTARHRLLDNAMSIPDSNGKSKGQAAVLREVSNYYWDQNRSIGEWWGYWLGSIILWLACMALAFSIISMFMPLVAIIGGMTGSKF